jgi:hypothetical protein
MKIDKIVFSSSASAEYAPFWNLQAQIWKTKFGIEPICLLFGKKSEVSMSEEHGKVIEMETDPSLPWSVQMVWSKFDYPTHDPDSTYLIGDIDLIPLQRAHFVDKIAGVDDNAYVHLNASGISAPRLGVQNGFLTHGSQRHALDKGANGGADLPAHYHVAKGRAFELLTQGRPFLDQVRHIVNSDRYGLGPMGDKNLTKESAYHYYWCGEEHYSSEVICDAIRGGSLNFVPIYYHNGNGHDRVDRDAFRADYAYDHGKAAAQGFVDVHCARPYSRQEEQLARLLKTVWGI